MSTEFQPGTVAIATVRGVEGVRVMRCGGAEQQGFWWTPEYAGDVLGNEPQWRQHEDREVTDVRPLVVLDPRPLYEDGEAGDAADFVRTLRLIARGDGNTYRSQIVLRAADQIEAQTKPPRIPEPGLWGVVSSEGSAWVRQAKNGPRDWHHYIDGWRSWSDLIDPVLIREGVES